MSLEEFKNMEDLYKAKTFGTIQPRRTVASLTGEAICGQP